jgi:uncharacterized membrane protein YfcA
MKMEPTSVLILLAIGVLAGMLSGMVGVGGGIIIVPALVFFLGFTQHQAQGTSLAMMVPPIGIMAVYNYYRTGNVNLWAAGILCLTFFIGAYFGSKVSLKLDQASIKRVFGVVMLLVSIKFLWGK